MIKNKEHGLLIIVSGPSGCGKSTVDNMLIEKRKNIQQTYNRTSIKNRIQKKWNMGIDLGWYRFWK